MIIAKSDFLKNRYIGQLYNNFIFEENRNYFLDNNVYIKLYKSGFSVFEHHSLFGVGTKNYRVATCGEKNSIKKEYYCSTHPHQIYIEFLAEHGVIGSLICFSIFFYLIFKNLKKNYSIQKLYSDRGIYLFSNKFRADYTWWVFFQ